MSRFCHLMLSMVLVNVVLTAQAQAVQSGGAQVVVPASGELVALNDQALATLMIEEQDKDKAAAASRVNQKMKQGMEIVRKLDPQAVLKTYGYFTYAVYAEDARNNKARQVVGWRVGQYLEVKTANLSGLPKTVAAAQTVLALNGLRFGLSQASSRKLDADLIKLTYSNLHERIAAISHAMGRAPADVVLETVDFEGSGNYIASDAAPKVAMMRVAAPVEAVAEPSFEPGESTLSMRVVGKFRFK